MPSSSPSVLVIRLDAIGDALALTPMLEALRKRSIPADVVLAPANAEALSATAARRIVVANGVRQRADDRSTHNAIAKLGAALREASYTHVLVATEDPAGYRLARETRAPVRVGFTNLLGKPLKSLWSARYVNVRVFRSAGLDPRAPHECEVLFQLARSVLGEDAMPSRDALQLRPFVVDGEADRDERVAVQITDKWDRLGIPFEQVVKAVEHIARAQPIRLIAAERERPYAQRFATATSMSVERFESLGPWKAAIAGARAVVAPDSGALHVAGMVGTPVVGVFPASRDFELQVARWSPWAAPYRIVRAENGWPRIAASALGALI